MSSRNSSGVTLVEVLLALTILTLVAGALSQGTNYLTRRLVRARFAAQARNLAWKRLVQARVEPLTSGHRSGIFGADFPGFSWDETVSSPQAVAVSPAGLFNYKLNVAWKQGWESDHISLETMIYQHLTQQKKPDSEK
jgi:prepilin-type N-terminal cleavage/methylation domain-containing protein